LLPVSTTIALRLVASKQTPPGNEKRAFDPTASTYWLCTVTVATEPASVLTRPVASATSRTMCTDLSTTMSTPSAGASVTPVIVPNLALTPNACT